MARHNLLGKKGEDMAVAYLESKAYQIVARNWISDQKNEIDIIAQKDETIIFIEVKTRTSSFWGNPETAISANKINRLTEAADCYLYQHESDKAVRFDVIAIICNNSTSEIEHIEDAFVAPLN